ncbi:MAG: peptidoglycan-binding protein [Rhodovulum sulfidophilum]|uniref:Peptidoglycan-binding protein n=1 Tax=Rhodovulum sulfidophilum TaxID=35806 RepID=A0A2W5NKG6_RHOSU|nr:MAG: peptidoglycan-binding protein [Rhodovulum sulfidophilum]
MGGPPRGAHFPRTSLSIAPPGAPDAGAVAARGAMKRIVICCDGTWKRLDARHPTNVVRLAQAVAPRGPDGVAQIVYHIDGVGAGRGTGRIARALDRVLGGAFGQGLLGTIEAAYRFLVFNHAPGDEIFLFGFSRGAFCARSLAGLIRNCGVLEKSAAAAIPEALALYRGRGETAHPDAPPAVAFRRAHAQPAHTSPADHAARPEAREPVRIAYLGVWDTVGSLGLPVQFRLAELVNRSLRFHDTRLSKGVAAARHAVAIDERRRTFPPALWDNLDALNREAGAERYAQSWFPGDHGSVGGGGAARALSDDALLWVAEGAVARGLALEPGALAEWRAARNPMGPLRARPRRGLLDALLALGPAERRGPERRAEVAEAAIRRFRADPGYRPAALTRLLGAPAEAPCRA